MTRSLVFLSRHGRLPVFNMFDVDGEQTDDPDLAVSLVAPLPSGDWLMSDCEAGEIVREGLN